jgi:predicted HicB family RNase H-like nuclease
MISYKGYKGHFNYDSEADIFHGKIIGLKDVVTFQGRSIDELKQSIKDSVDDYLEMCKTENKSPDKPFSGRFSLRLNPELHSKVAIAAALNKKSINMWITESVKDTLDKQNIIME